MVYLGHENLLIKEVDDFVEFLKMRQNKERVKERKSGHCDHCLTKTSKTGVVTYFYYGLKAEMVTSTGLAISLASEFVGNTPGL